MGASLSCPSYVGRSAWSTPGRAMNLNPNFACCISWNPKIVVDVGIPEKECSYYTYTHVLRYLIFTQALFFVFRPFVLHYEILTQGGVRNEER